MKPLNPIMAVLAIASVGVLPLRTLASGGKAPVGVAVKAPAGVAVAAEDANSITKLTEILNKNSKAKDDVGQRIADFLLKPDAAKKSFVAADVGAKELEEVAKAWAKKQTPGNLAMLYFVVGTGPNAPDWVKNDEFLKKTVLPVRDAEARLRTALSRFADAGGAQIKKAKEKEDAVAFLDTAAIEAKKIFDDPRPKPVVDGSINGNDNTGVNAPDTTRGSRSRLDGAMQRYTLKDLYEDGAVVVDVSGPKDEHSRRISMKIYSKRVDGVIVNEIGIFDLTDAPDDIFGQRFPITGGAQTFALDDRTPGKKKYTLTFGQADANGNRDIKLARPGDGGAELNTTTKELFLKRADQAADMKNIVTVGGQEFYVLPQGGVRSALTLYPKALIDGRGTGNPRQLEPLLYAEVGKRGPNGGNQNLPGKPGLGKVGKNEFHLEFNEDLGVWEVKDGAGDPPPKDPAAGGGAGGAGSNPDGTTPEASPDSRSFPDMLLTFKEHIDAGRCKYNPDDIKELAPNLKDKYGVVACTYNQRDGLKQVIIVPKTKVHESQQIEYGHIEGFKLLRARFFDHYLILEYDKQVHYRDLYELEGEGPGFALAGYISNGEAAKFTSTVPFLHAIQRYLKNVPAAALTEIPKRVAAAQGNKPYYLSGTFPKGVFLVMVTSDGSAYQIWPELTKPGATPEAPTSAPYTTVSGPTNAFDGSVASDDATFPDKIKLGESREAKAIKTQADIVMYASVDEPKKHFVMFRYNSLDPKVPTEPNGEKVKKAFRQKPLEVFNAANPYPGDDVQMQGLMEAVVVKDRVESGYKFISGSTKARGVLAMFQNKQVTATNAKEGDDNCVGPLVWWGLSSRDEALKACKEDKL